MTESFLIIAHSKRGDGVPHWMHQATLASLKKPCQTADMYEGHIFDIGRSRQRIVEMFLSIPEATHLLFVDDDLIIPHCECLVGMFNWLEKQHEYIVSGLYLEKSIGKLKCPTCNTPKHRPIILAMSDRDGQILCAFPYADKPVPKNTLIPVGAVPAGFLLIKREVFQKLEPPWFVYGDPELEKHRVGDGAPWGEDIYFSLKARKAGFKLWIDTRASLLHYNPGFAGLPEDMAFVQSGAEDAPREVETMRAEYLNELKKRESRTPT